MITQSLRVISEGLNMAHKLLRFRARPKLLLCLRLRRRRVAR